MNPTPDGNIPGESKSSPLEIHDYLSRISGLLLNRIDLHVKVLQVNFREISSERNGQTSAAVARSCSSQGLFDRLEPLAESVAFGQIQIAIVSEAISSDGFLQADGLRLEPPASRLL